MSAPDQRWLAKLTRLSLSRSAYRKESRRSCARTSSSPTRRRPD